LNPRIRWETIGTSKLRLIKVQANKDDIIQLLKKYPECDYQDWENNEKILSPSCIIV
jgi:hypothetical protein